jgi:signal transduction histidine kinase/ActR/RegA family two-component response regulator
VAAAALDRRAILGRNPDRNPTPVSALGPQSPPDPQRIFGAMVDALVEPVVVVGPDGVVTLVNAAAAQLLGADRALGRPVAEHLDRLGARDAGGAPLPPPLHPVSRALAQGQAVIGAELLVDTEGGPRICVVNAVPLPVAAGARPGVIAVFHDITDAARLERQVAEQAARLETIVDLVDEGVIVVDPGGRFLFLNEPARRVVAGAEGLASGERVRRFPVFDLDGRPVPPPALPSSRALHGEVVTGMEVLLEIPGAGRRRLRVNAHPLRDHAGNVGAAVVSWKDVTDEVQAREELEAARETAEEASRLKDQFIAALSHELRTPLQPILGWTEVLRRHKSLDDVTTRALEAIHRNIRQQVRLVDDLLDLSRIVHGKFMLRLENLDLREPVRIAVEAFEDAAALKRLRLVAAIPADPLPMWGDGARLHQITTNLLSNALKFTPAGGQVTVTLTASGDRATLEIADTGPGIAPEDMPVIFEAFRQGGQGRGGGGLGLGLDLVRRLTELHGGSVRVGAAGPGGGSSFRVELPLALPAAMALRRGVQPSRRLDDRSILVVEDDDDTREVLRFMLEAEGARVGTAATGADGVRAAERLHPEVVLCDIGLPDFDGMEVARRLRARPDFGGLRLIALTGYGQAEDIRLAIEAGFDAHITKPVNLDQLMALLPARGEPLTGARPAG